MSDIQVLPADGEKHLNLLAVFYYVFAGLMALGSSLALLYVGLGVLFLVSPESVENPGDGLSTEAMGYLFAGIGIVLLALGWGWAAALAYTGRYLKRRVNRGFCLVIAALCCLSVPLGTILGIVTMMEHFGNEIRPRLLAPADHHLAPIRSQRRDPDIRPKPVGAKPRLLVWSR